MRVWLCRSGRGIRILIQRKINRYFEITDINYIRSFMGSNKRRRISLSKINRFEWVYTKFPSKYKHSFQRGWYLEGDRIYYHQVRDIMKKIYKK